MALLSDSSQDLYHVWKEMVGYAIVRTPFNHVSHRLLQGWKGSVKATHLVITLHDHFTVKASRKTTITSTGSGSGSGSGSPDAPAETVDNTNPT